MSRDEGIVSLIGGPGGFSIVVINVILILVLVVVLLVMLVQGLVGGEQEGGG